FLSGISIAAIMADPNAAEIVPELPVQALYYAIKQKGMDEVLDLLPLLSQEQVERMIDYDAWSHDQLVPKKLFQFLKAFGEVSREQLYERFAHLDEEYQLATLQNFFRVYEVEVIYDLPEAIQDLVYAMPCNTVFYEILSEDPEEIAFVEELMEAAKECNMRYAYSLLGHASYMPPAEQAAQVAIFRKARLEEDGFVSYQDSLQLFMPVDRLSLLSRWNPSVQTMNLASLVQKAGQGAFLDAVLEAAQEEALSLDELYAMHQGFLYLANALCAASHVEPDDIVGLNRLLEQGKAIVSLGLEYIAQGQLEVGIAALRGESCQTLFRVGLSLVDEIRAELLHQLLALRWPRSEVLMRHYLAKQWGQIQLELDRHWIEQVGLQSGEILKGLFNRFPMVPMRTMQDQNRIIFAPIINLTSLMELEKNIQAVLGYLYCATQSGLPLQQPVDLILRSFALQSLQSAGYRGKGVPELLKNWKSQLRLAKEQWWVGEAAFFEETLDVVMAMVHEELHGLIVLPVHKPALSSDDIDLGGPLV
ncbi:MAG: DUF6178 family protein, partial [Proteobacteria bacterium]|nr:DUF6178 family protein [Pseudomonadota bacterium]